jgi:hypothetical protein
MKTITRVYDTYAQAREVVNDLRAAGISEASTSLIANKHVSAAHDDVKDGASAGAGLGAAVGGAGGLLAGLGIIAIPGIGPVVAAGWLVAALTGAIAGAAAGGIIGALVDAGVSTEDAEVYSEAVRRGGTLVTVRAEDADVARVQAILDRRSPINPALRRGEYAKAGWTGYDPKAKPYNLSDAERERIRSPYV